MLDEGRHKPRAGSFGAPQIGNLYGATADSVGSRERYGNPGTVWAQHLPNHRDTDHRDLYGASCNE